MIAAPSIDSILDRLDGVRRTRRGWSARCPAHRDRSPSLSVALGDGGRPLLHCFAGCEYTEITRALGLERSERTTTSPSGSTFGLALAIARRQAWYREERRLLYAIADGIRRRRRAVAVARRAATAAGDRPESWSLLTTAAHVEIEAELLEMRIEEVCA